MENHDDTKQKFINNIVKNSNIFAYMYKLYIIPNGEQRDFRLGILYDKLVSYISNKDKINSVNEIFKYYNSYTSGKKISGKKILTAYIIASFPEYVLSLKRKNISIEKHRYLYQIYDIAKKLICHINDLCISEDSINILDLVSCIDKYTEYFDIFIKLDRIKSINKLINHWCDSKETIERIEESDKYKKNTYQKNKVLVAVKNTQKNIEKHIKKFDKNFDIGKLNTYYDMKKKVTANVKKAFYNKLHTRYSN